MDSTAKLSTNPMVRSEFLKQSVGILGRKIDNEISISSKKEVNIFSSTRSERKFETMRDFELEEEDKFFKAHMIMRGQPQPKSLHTKPKRQENPS
jgi:hypothetical protein